MKVLVLAATGGTGRLIVRFRPGERPFRRPSHPRSALISVALRAGTAGRGHGGLVFDRRFPPLLLSHGRLIAERFNPFKPQQEDRFEYES